MTLDDLLTELAERGWELDLHGPALGKWEAYVRAWRDESCIRVAAVGHARNHSPLSAVSDAMERCERSPEQEVFVSDTNAIDHVSGQASQHSSGLLAKLGLLVEEAPLRRRV